MTRPAAPTAQPASGEAEAPDCERCGPGADVAEDHLGPVAGVWWTCFGCMTLLERIR